MKNTLKRFISFFLVMIIVTSAIPSFSFAASANAMTISQLEKIDGFHEGNYLGISCKEFCNRVWKKLYGTTLGPQKNTNGYTLYVTGEPGYSYIDDYQVGNTLSVSNGNLSKTELNKLFSQAQAGDVIQFKHKSSLHAAMIFSNDGSTIELLHTGKTGYKGKVTKTKYASYDEFFNKWFNGSQGQGISLYRSYNAPSKPVNNYVTCDMNLKTAESHVCVRSGPGKKYPVKYHLENVGTPVHIVAMCENEYVGHKWCKLDDGNWIYKPRLQEFSSYKVKYYSKLDGAKDIPSSQIKTESQELRLSPNTPYKKGYLFMGWSKDSSIQPYYEYEMVAIQFVNYQPYDIYAENKKADLYAVWLKTSTSISSSSYNVQLCIDDNKTSNIDMVLTGTINSKFTLRLENSAIVESSITPIKLGVLDWLGSHINGYRSKGTATLTLKAKKPGKDYVFVNVYNENNGQVARVGVYVNVTKKYNVVYNANGGSNAPNKTIRTSGSNAYISSVIPNRTNYTFMGWSESSDNDTAKVIYGPGDIYNLDRDITLYAVWKENYHIDYNFDATTKTLIISGKGDMACYGSNNPAPWSSEYASATEKIEIKSGVTSIGSYAFYGFKNLKEVKIANSITRIYSYAFADCINLFNVETSLNIDLKSSVYKNCKNLSTYGKNTMKTATVSSGSAITTQGSIGAFVFENCINLQSIDLSDVNSIGESAFSGCTALNDVVLADNLDVIEDGVFYNCTDLENIEIPNSVTEISDGAFSGCTSLESIEIPEGVDTLGEQAFSGCSSITSVSVPESVDYIGNSVFSNCTALKNVDLPDDMFVIADSMFSGCTSLKSIDIPESVLSLGDGTFFGCTALNSIDIPESVGEIGDNTFAYCSSLKNITIPDSVSVIDNFAFWGCEVLADVTLSANTDSIGACSFGMCTSLKKLAIPESVTEIGEAAFVDCTSLSTVDFAESMVSIGDEAFAGCTALTGVVIPECAVYVSSTAFNNCSEKLKISCYSTSEIYDELVQNGTAANTIYPVQGMSLNKEAASLKKGETVQLKSVFNPANATNKNTIWTSQNEDVATVSKTGLVTAVGSGTAVICATSEDGNFETYCEVICTVPVESIEIDGDYSECFVGTETYIVYRTVPENPTNIDVNFNTSNSNVATVNEDGLILIKGKGQVTITVTSADGNAKTSFVINATEFVPINEVVLSSSKMELPAGTSAILSGIVKPSNSTNKSLYYYSENEDIANVDQNGKVTAVKPGTTIIVCVGDEVEAVCEITVCNAKSSVVSVSIEDKQINYKNSAVLNTNIKTEGNAKYTVEYWSSDSGKVSVDQNGKIYGAKRGSAIIHCAVTDEFGKTIEDTCTVKVDYSVIQWIIKIVLFGWIWY